MKKYFISIAVLSIVIFGFGFSAFAHGEDDSLNFDEITSVDLGVLDVGALPGDRFYFLKEWRRSIARVLTFSAVKKTELELYIVNEKAAEALTMAERKPDDPEAFTKAIENYTDATNQLEARLIKLKETSENPNIGKLLGKLDAQTLKHAILFNHLAERWAEDPYAEDANTVKPEAARDNHLQGAVDVLQKKIHNLVLIGAGKDKHIERKAEEQIARAEEAIKKLESELAEFAINEPGVPNNKHAINTKGGGANSGRASEPDVPNKETGPIRIDSTPARISTNLTIERQTPKRDFGDRMKAGLETAGGMLANAKTAFAEGKFGEAFGQARAAEVIAWHGLSLFRDKDNNGSMGSDEKIIPRPGVDADTPRIEDSAYDNKLRDIKECGPQMGAPGNWVCKDGGWVLDSNMDDSPSFGGSDLNTDSRRACTQEAKICPDGSAVGKTGPNCEFAACPAQTGL